MRPIREINIILAFRGSNKNKSYQHSNVNFLRLFVRIEKLDLIMQDHVIRIRDPEIECESHSESCNLPNFFFLLLFFYIRVNYTLIPSKMLELHSPSLLC